MIFKAWRRLPKKADAEKGEKLREEPLEKGDRFAMVFSAFLTLFLPAVGVLLVIGGLAYLVFAVL